MRDSDSIVETEREHLARRRRPIYFPAMSLDHNRAKPARPRQALLRWLAMIVLVVVLGLWLFMRGDWAAKDSCLDAGGRWIDGACDGARPGG
jgi:hypothetical protein